MLLPPELIKIADRQHGLVEFRQATASAMSKSGWFRRLDSGLLISVAPRVARLPGAPVTDYQTIAAWVIAGGSAAMASHRSAARLWGLDITSTDPVDIVFPGRHHRRQLDGAMVHRPSDPGDLRAVRRHGIAVAVPSRTVVDLGATAAPDDVARFVEHLVMRRTMSFAAIVAAVDRLGGRGRAGAGVLRDVLTDWHFGAQPPDSVLESRFLSLLRDNHLPLADFHYRVGVGAEKFELDFAYPDRRVDIEIDGWEFHSDRRSFEHDRRRDTMLRTAGWTVLRFTWRQVNAEPAWVTTSIREVLQVARVA